MSHKTLVNGTVYEVGGGKTLIDGVAYSIDKGKTLVGGTAYEVGFDDGMRKITVTRDYTGGGSPFIRIAEYITFRANGYCDGLAYSTWTSPATIEVPVGTQFFYSGEVDGAVFEVVLNGSVVSSKNDWIDYGWYTVTENMTFAMTRVDNRYILTITET